jgi:formamidopyrimidine-DNA glycosylase
MPELPEVETVRRDISGLFVGDTLRRLVVTGRRTVRRHDPSLLARIEGQELVGVARHGKFLCFDWGAANVLVAHLRMSGQLLAATAGDAAVAHTHAVFAFSTGRELRFVDPRTFGELFLASAPQGAGAGPPRERVSELAHLGPDALAAEPAQLRAALAGRRAPLKSLLVDQRVLAGIGNIYADEICFGAGLRPDRPGGALDPAEVGLLARSTQVVLEAAVAARGSTLGDQQYRDVAGEAGRFQLQHRVYGRSGLPCVSCGRRIERVRWGAKSAFWCPGCQR